MRRTTALAVAAIATAAIAATGCSSSTDTPTGSGHSATESPAEAPSSAAASPTTDSGAGTGGKPVAVHQTIDDPEMGHHVVVQRVVRHFPVPDSMSAVSDREMVLVEVEVTAGSKYYAGWHASSLSVVADGTENAQSTASGLVTAMSEAGYEPMAEHGDVHTGKTGAGWVGFVVDPEDAPTLTLRMKRSAARTSDGGSISAHDFDVPLTEAS